ncbi:lachesin-like isoform X2 [Folsomia candida]|uniref:lachesin-like isoform X2 n=1 Tax=Folsomia candida TaxID=158441 RepID=UPI00160505C8|nr:lachesin-like isoform X2 [Folsomia candida]
MSNFLIFTFLGLLAIGRHPSDGGQVASEFQPEFAEPLENLTIAIGRDATFLCSVRGLGGYRVGWVRADTKAIQAIHNHVITHNPRVSVSHSDHTMWHLHIKGVKEEDRGSYMCQINTDPMTYQIAFLEVVIPPDFIPEETSSDLMAPEGSTVKLICNSRGHPQPTITFRREGGQNITLKSNSGSKSQVSVFEGNVLRLVKISRADMGPYLCIASNGVPPSISKRITVSVHFHPVIQVPNQLIGSPINTDVQLECNVEAFPKSIHFWTKDNGAMIISGDRYDVQDIVKSMFEVKMVLTIRKFRKVDAGFYKCTAKNSLGDVESVVKVLAVNSEAEASSKSKNELPLLSYDDDYYDTPDVANPVGSSNSRTSGSDGNKDGKNHRQDHQTRISNNFTPGGNGAGGAGGGGSGDNNNNRLASNSNNNINNGRHSRKSYSSSSGNSNNNLGSGKNRDRDTNNPNDNDNTPFQKTVVVSLSPNGLPGKGTTNHKYQHGMHKLFFAISFLWHLHFLLL